MENDARNTEEEEEGLVLKVRTARWNLFNWKFKAYFNFFLIDRCRLDRQIDDVLLSNFLPNKVKYTALHSWCRCV